MASIYVGDNSNSESENRTLKILHTCTLLLATVRFIAKLKDPEGLDSDR